MARIRAIALGAIFLQLAGWAQAQGLNIPPIGQLSHAVDITSLTADQNRIEGEDVEVSARVSWGVSLQQNLQSQPTRTVRAIATPSPIATPAIPTQLNLVYDSATKRYRGRFEKLPFSAYTVRVTATQTVKSLGVPSTTRTSTDVATSQFRIASAPGCFNFDDASFLQGWTGVGPFDGGTENIIAGSFRPVTTWLSSAGFLSAGAADPDGALVLALSDQVLPNNRALFTTGFYRFDLISPSLASNSAWQGAHGISFRLRHNLSGTQVLPLLEARRPDGTTTFIQQVDAAGNAVLLTVPAQTYNVITASIPVSAGYTIIGARIRVFGPASATTIGEGFVFADGVCPQH